MSERMSEAENPLHSPMPSLLDPVLTKLVMDG
jgi:hypothetical protein